MKTDKKTVYKYLVLVPHKETREILKKYTDNLIKNGLKGVYPFPFVGVLKELDKAMSAEELKKYAKDLREKMGNEKFKTIGTDCLPFKTENDKFKLHGILSQRRRDEENAELLIGLFLSKDKDKKLQNLPEISFRTAAVANFYIKQIPNGFKWKIGNLYWLPKTRKKYLTK